MGEQVGAVPVVVVVRDHHADLVQRRGPAELAPRPRSASCGADAVVAAPARPRARARPARCRPRSAAAARAPSASRMSPGARAARRSSRSCEIEDHALAQRAARRLQRVDAEVRRQRVEDRTGRRRSPRGGRPSGRAARAGRRGRPRGSARCTSAGPAGVIVPSVMPLARSTCDTAPTVPEEPSASRQWRRRERRAALPRARRRRRPAPRGTPARVKRPSAKYFIDRLTLPTWNDSATRGVRPRPRIISVERPPMSITSRGCVRRLQPRDAGEDQARFLAAGDDLDRDGRARLRARARKALRLRRLAQGLRRHRAHLLRREAVRGAARSAPGRSRPRAGASSVSTPSASSPPPRRTVSFR